MNLNKAWHDSHNISLQRPFLTDPRMIKSGWFSALVISFSQFAVATPDYSDASCPYYSQVLKSLPSFAPDTPLQSEEVIQSPSRFAMAKVTRTDDIKVHYDEEEAHIEITSTHFPPLYIRIHLFRAMEVKWVTDRILYIWRDIGHTGGTVEELVDVMDRKWLSQKCVTDDGK